MICKFKDWLTIPIELHDIIINASVKNGSDSFVDEPIGVCYHYLTSNEKKAFINHPQMNSQLCLSSMSITTDRYRRANAKINRRTIANTLLRKNFIQTIRGSPDNFYKNIGKFKFVICPEGNGVDTHRLWETIYSKGIPILEENEDMRQKVGSLPILWTIDYSELTLEYLEEQYKFIMEEEFDFSPLFLTKYRKEQIDNILDRTQKWCHKFQQQNEFNDYKNSVYKAICKVK